MLRVWIACIFGWNRKQIVFLRRCPIVLRTTTAVGLSNMTFYEEFKNRAGHNVLAAIEDGGVLRGGIAEKAIDAWKNTGGAMTKDDAWRLETPRSSIIAALDDYETMANAVRKFDVDGSCADYFFLCLTRNDGLSIHSQMEISHFGNLFPKGTNFQAIRKTAQLIQFTKVGSAAAQIASSGHSSARTLMKYYLNTEDFRNELDSSIRFLQNCLAANVAVKGGFEDRLEVPAEIIKWFANFSRLCGLEAVARKRDPLARRYSFQVKFTADQYTLGELYLSHLSLRMEYHRHERRRWLIQGLGQLAAVKFFGRKILAHAGMPEYFRVARQISRRLRSGEISLPPMLD